MSTSKMNRMTGIVCLAMVIFTAASAGEIDLYSLNEPILSTCPQSEESLAADALNQLRSKIITKNAKLLTSILTGACEHEHTLRYNTYIASIYNPTLVASVFRETVANLYNNVKPEKLAAQLWSIYRLTDKPSYELMLITQLQLFDKFIKRGDINSQYLLNVGYYFHKAKNDELYEQIDEVLKNDLNQAINKLPSSLLNFFFRPGFCLYNKGYQEYMYQADGMFHDDQRRYIFNWVPAGGEFSQGALEPIFHKINNDNAINAGATPFKVVLRGRKFGKFMYMDAALQNLVIAWERGTQPDNARWSVQFVQSENALVLRCGQDIVCASEKLYEYKERRFIYGMNNETYTDEKGDCQWLVRRCP